MDRYEMKDEIMKNTRLMAEDKTMDFEEWAVEEETKMASPDRKPIPKISAKFYLLRQHWVEIDADDYEQDDDAFDTYEEAMKGAARKAVKGNAGVIYVAQVLTKVEQTNFEQMVKSSPITDPSNLIEAPADV